MEEVRKVVLHLEKRDMDAVIRFINNLKAQGMLNAYLCTTGIVRFEYWPEALRVEVYQQT